MSAGRKTTKYAVTALTVGALIIIASTFYYGLPVINPSQSTGTGQLGPNPSTLVIETTDPPEVPTGTTSLTLNYSSIGMLIGEPSAGGQQVVKELSVAPSGGIATLDLLSLENVSQTVASAELPNGTTIYSFSFAIIGISIDVNGTSSTVMLATGGDSLNVTLARPASLEGTNVALLELNPLVVSTPTGYQLIPNAIGIIKVRPQLQVNETTIGFRHSLSSQDYHYLQLLRGSITADLMILGVGGNTTTIEVQVSNTGNSTVLLEAISISGNFTAKGVTCRGSSNAPGSMKHSDEPSFFVGCGHVGEIVLVPSPSRLVSTTTSESDANGCSTGELMTSAATVQSQANRGMALKAGQCVDLEFVGVLTYGFRSPHGSPIVFVPSAQPSQVYEVQVAAIPAALVELSCTLLISSAASCTVVTQTGLGQPNH